MEEELKPIIKVSDESSEDIKNMDDLAKEPEKIVEGEESWFSLYQKAYGTHPIFLGHLKKGVSSKLP